MSLNCQLLSVCMCVGAGLSANQTFHIPFSIPFIPFSLFPQSALLENSSGIDLSIRLTEESLSVQLRES